MPIMLLFVLGIGSGVDPAVIYDTRSILKEFFIESEKVTYVRIEPKGRQRSEIESRLGASLDRASYIFYVAKTGDRVDGFAYLDRAQGRSLPFRYALKISPAGVVQRLEIIEYRSQYGDEIREERFRHQFVGKTARDRIRLGDDVDAISGATINSRSITPSIRRALVLFDSLVIGPAAPGSLIDRSTGVPREAIPGTLNEEDN